MATCFANTHFSSEDTFIEVIIFLAFVLTPFVNFIYGFVYIFQIYKAIKKQKNQRKIFWKYISYVGTYFIVTMLMISLYVIDSIINLTTDLKIGDLPVYRYYSYTVAIILCSCSFLVGIVKILINQTVRKEILKLFCSYRTKSNEKIEEDGVGLPLLEDDMMYEKGQLKRVKLYIIFFSLFL